MSEQMVHKVVLSSGKEVLLKPMQIKYQNLAIQAVGKRAGDNQALLGSMVQQELLKILLLQVDGEEVSSQQKEDLDSLFSFLEFQQVLMAVNQIAGGAEDVGNFQIEHVASGSSKRGSQGTRA